MARITRVVAPGVPHHVTQRGNTQSAKNKEIAMTEEKEGKTYEWRKCGAVFDSREALRKHIYDEHIDNDG